MAVHEQFMTETAAMADIVLPATMFMEHDDLYYGGGHQHISVGAKLIDPPGECRSNHEVLQGLGRRLNASASRLRDDAARIDRRHAEEERPRRHRDAGGRSLARHPAGFSHLALSRRLCARRQEVPLQGRLGASAVRQCRDGRLGARCRRCRTTGPSSRRRTRRIRSGSRPAPRAASSIPASTRRRRRRRARAAPSVMMHPADAAALGIADGDAVTLGNTRGETTLTAKLFDGLRRGVLIAELIHPNKRPYRRRGHQHADRRRGGRADRRRGVPRQQGLGQEGRTIGHSGRVNRPCSPPPSCRKCAAGS